jgi:hypothetical protein
MNTQREYMSPARQSEISVAAQLPPIDIDEWHHRDRAWNRDHPGGWGTRLRDARLEEYLAKKGTP